MAAARQSIPLEEQAVLQLARLLGSLRIAVAACLAFANPGDEAASGTPQAGETICPKCHGTGRSGSGDCLNCGGAGRAVQIVGDA